MMLISPRLLLGRSAFDHAAAAGVVLRRYF